MRTLRKTFGLIIAVLTCPISFPADTDVVSPQGNAVRAITNRIHIFAPPLLAAPHSSSESRSAIAPGSPIRPSATYSQQPGGFSRPEGTFSRPESTFSRPQSTFHRPSSTFDRPGPTFERLQSTFERRGPTFERPVGTFYNPVTSYLHASPTIIVEQNLVTTRGESLTEPVEQQILQQEVATPAPEKLIVVDLPPGARIVKPAPTAP